MTNSEYRKALKALDLSIVGASVLGISRRQAQRIYADECPVPGPLALLLRAMLKHGIEPADLEKL